MNSCLLPRADAFQLRFLSASLNLVSAPLYNSVAKRVHVVAHAEEGHLYGSYQNLFCTFSKSYLWVHVKYAMKSMPIDKDFDVVLWDV